MKTITMTTKAFSTERKGQYQIAVDTDGTVRVWDAVAGHYTTCHAMTARSQQAARTKAARS